MEAQLEAELEVILGVQGLLHVVYFALCSPNPVSGEGEADFFFLFRHF